MHAMRVRLIGTRDTRAHLSASVFHSCFCKFNFILNTIILHCFCKANWNILLKLRLLPTASSFFAIAQKRMQKKLVKIILRYFDTRYSRAAD